MRRLPVDATGPGKIVDENHPEGSDNDEKLSDTLIIVRHLLFCLLTVCAELRYCFQIIIFLNKSVAYCTEKILCKSNFPSENGK